MNTPPLAAVSALARATPPAVAALTCLALLYAPAAPAQIDLSGNWAPADSPDQLHQAVGPYPVDFLGIPLNQAGREYAATAAPSDELEELSRQCQTWLVNYFVEGPFPIAIRPLTDPFDESNVIAWRLSGTPDRLPENIWMDGRSAPAPNARRTWTGFAAGHWDGDTLDVSITGIKDGWLTRNDAPQSNQSTASMFLSREDDLLTMTYVVNDPVYLGAPFIRGRTFRYTTNSPTYNIPTGNDCMPSEVVSGLSDGYHAARFLPGKNPDLKFMQQHYNIPAQVALGSPEQIYPEFRKVLRTEYTTPTGYCREDCCAAQAIRGTNCPAPPAAAPGSEGAAGGAAGRRRRAQNGSGDGGGG